MQLVNNVFKLLTALLIVHGCSLAHAAEYDINNSAQVEAFVDGALVPLMKQAHSQSAVIVIKKGDDVILSKGYGLENIAEGKAIDPQTSMFRPGSISKLFTWLSVMQLVEQGKLDLDSDVNKYLKRFQIKDSFPGMPVTLRHIMTHTAGFEDGGFGYLIVKDPSKIMPLWQALKKYQPERVYSPGERIAYSNWATALAGLIIENTSGEDFYSYVENHFFIPLGMQYATFREPIPTPLAEHEAKPYLFENGSYVAQDYELIGNFAPAGSAAVSAGDMVKFGEMILNGGSYNNHQFLKSETIQYMLDNGYVKDPRIHGMGLGFIKTAYGNANVKDFGHSGATTLFYSYLGLSQQQDLVMFLSVSADRKVLNTFLDTFYQAFYPKPLPNIAAPEDFASYGHKYEGIYTKSRSNFSKIDSFFMLAMGTTKVTLMPDNTLLIGEDRYVEEQPNLFRALYRQRRAVFLENDEGEITGFVWDGAQTSEFYRAKWWHDASLNYLLLGAALLAWLLVFIRASLQWSYYSGQGIEAKRAYLATLAVAGSHLMFVIFMAIAVSDESALFYSIPLSFKLALCAAMVAVPCSSYHLYTTVNSWLGKGMSGSWDRAKHTSITILSVVMLLFYYAWNFLGFNYF